MSKAHWIEAHMELVEEYLERHPSADWDEAYEAPADAANDRYRDKYADMVDAAKQRAKDASNWPPKPETITRDTA